MVQRYGGVATSPPGASEQKGSFERMAWPLRQGILLHMWKDTVKSTRRQRPEQGPEFRYDFTCKGPPHFAMGAPTERNLQNWLDSCVLCKQICMKRTSTSQAHVKQHIFRLQHIIL